MVYDFMLWNVPLISHFQKVSRYERNSDTGREHRLLTTLQPAKSDNLLFLEEMVASLMCLPFNVHGMC